jgi:hypothetical protein
VQQRRRISSEAGRAVERERTVIGGLRPGEGTGARCRGRAQQLGGFARGSARGRGAEIPGGRRVGNSRGGGGGFPGEQGTRCKRLGKNCEGTARVACRDGETRRELSGRDVHNQLDPMARKRVLDTLTGI